MDYSRTIIQADTLAELKSIDPSLWKAGPSYIPLVLMIGKSAIDDGISAFFRWDPTSSLAEDTNYMNVVISDATATGRWVRVFQRVRILPQGILVMNGGVKTLYVSTVTNASGEAQINLTYENTAGGTAIFKEVWKNHSSFKGDASTIANAVQSYVKVSAETALYKTTTHGYYKANALTITIGLLFNPITSVGSNVPVVFEVVGV